MLPYSTGNWIRRAFCVAGVLLLLLPSMVFAANSPVVVVEIKGEIDAGQAALIHRAFNEAQQKGALAIVIELDTFGGLVEAAVQMRDRISDSSLRTICYIKNRAWSAGALIALANQHIAIAPGGSIGAAEPIPTTEKTVAAVKAEFAATANKTGRNPRIAEAMVDKSLGFPGYAEPGQILALTDYQAIKVGYAELIAADRDALLVHYGLTGTELVEISLEWPERLAGWLANPTVKSALLSLIFLAVMTEIKTAGMGVAAMVALAAAMLFFGGQWLAGVAGLMEIMLFAAGIILLVVELYMPGIGLFGIAGIACILSSIFLTLGADISALTTLMTSLAIALIIFLIIVKRLPASRLWMRLVLQDAETSKAGYISSLDNSIYIGKKGITITQLRPAGLAEIEGVRLDVISQGQFIEAGVQIKVGSVAGGRVVVYPIRD